MKKSIWIVIIIVIVVGGAAAVLATRKKSSSDTMANMPAPTASADASTSTDTSTAAPVASSAITIQNFAFSPASTTVKKGTTVTWTNQDSTTHTVIGDGSNTPSGFGSSQLRQGAKYSFTFNTAGTYAYQCGIHPSMQGTITVTE
jgi:plastocyanin